VSGLETKTALVHTSYKIHNTRFYSHPTPSPLSKRILEFADLEPERNLDNIEDPAEAVEVSEVWPQEGGMTFLNVKAKYRASLEYALKGISFEIKGGEKVGVVGRTGSGKSTLLQVIMRLLDVVEGTMTVDGVDTSKVPLRAFRKKFAVIPQTPTLFNVSLKENLDPFGEYEDSAIWDALDIVQMKGVIKGLGEGLDYMCSSGGGNFSVGQRQLLCLSRAILTKCKILIMDESAANVDPLTDVKLQEAVKKCFAGSTVLSIAHRLESVMEYDKVLVLGAGEILEYGAPSELLKDKHGSFYAMVEDSRLEG
jgi:ABC-type multidrug transport system fused ATPase/permease subunit